MRIMTAAAFASALAFAASQTAHAVPSINMKGGTQTQNGMVDLVAKKGGGGGPKSAGGRGVNAGQFKQSYQASRGISRSYSGKSYKGGKAYRGGKGYRAGKGYSRGKYAGRGYKGRYYRRGYDPFFWGGIGVGTGLAFSGANCGWYYRQAEMTGSAYWWQRYEDCVYGY